MTQVARDKAQPDLSGRLADHMGSVEERLMKAASFNDRVTRDAGRHLAEAGGKRVRPALTLLSAELGGGVNDEVITAAAVVELTHLATLYHDDVMDSAPTRRGAPSAHEVWGNTVAILTGDLLFARASQLVSSLGPDAVRIQAETFERLCAGQLRETVGPDHGEDPQTHYLSVLADKTGSLIATCGYFGCHLSGCSEEVTQAVVRYGEDVGVAFQLADDVIDISSAASESGKTPGTDLREGVPTLPVLFAREDARNGDAEAQATLLLVDGDLSDDAVLSTAVQSLRSLPATDRALAEARRYADRAASHLTVVPDGEAKDALVDFAESLVNRAT